MSAISDWWKTGEADAIAVYRATVIGPLISLTAIIGIVWLATRPDSKGSVAVLLALWILGAAGIALRRRRAAILTPDAFLYRPAFGSLLSFPLNGIKRASAYEWPPTEEFAIPTVRIDLLVGGSVYMRLPVSKSAEVIRRIDECAEARQSELRPPK